MIANEPTTDLPTRDASDIPAPVQRRVGLIQGSTQHFSRELIGLLQRRLRVGALIGLAGYAVYFLAAVFFQVELYKATTWQRVLLCVALGAIGLLTGLLWTSWAATLRRLRGIELGILAVTAAFLVWGHGSWFPLERILGYAAIGSEAEQATLYADMIALPWFVMIVAYGVFIPNTWQRGSAIIGLLAVAALGTAAASSKMHEDGRYLIVVLFELSIWISIAAAIAIYGSHRISALRQEAFEARKLGQYYLKESLGAGGMGEVFLAEHQLLRRPCAIKLIRPDHSDDPKMLARFEREVQVTARLTHANTVQVFDYGYSEDGTFYYVMEYLPGLNLHDMVRQHGPLPPARVVYLLRQVCMALSEAHTAGLIHRDLKPSNIIICERGGQWDVAKLLDFGLVQTPKIDGGNDQLTRVGSITGSPPYMSPEQAGGIDQLDARSDIYSLGCVAYYLLTAKPPFVRDSVVQVLAAHLYEPPRPLRELRADVPDDLERVVLRCLEKKSDQRFPCVGDLEAALAVCQCARDWSAQAGADWWREQRGGNVKSVSATS